MVNGSTYGPWIFAPTAPEVKYLIVRSVPSVKGRSIGTILRKLNGASNISPLSSVSLSLFCL